MGKGYRLQEYGPEVQAAIDKVQALGPNSLDEIGIRVHTTEYWNAQVGYIPAEGEIIIYTDRAVVGGKNVPGVKIGSGNAYVQDLAFGSDDLAASLTAHMSDTVAHVTAAERNFWNQKLNVNDSAEVVNGVLILNRN